jgi:hypothetical protein
MNDTQKIATALLAAMLSNERVMGIVVGHAPFMWPNGTPEKIAEAYEENSVRAADHRARLVLAAADMAKRILSSPELDEGLGAARGER